MNKKQNMVTFSVTSYEGDSEFSLLPKAALAKIRALEKEQNKWTFVGGEITDTSLMKESDLTAAMEADKEIILVNALAGGNMDKIVDIKFEVEKDIEELTLDFSENDYAKVITIFVPKEKLIDIIHNRKLIINALTLKLNAFAERQVDDLQTALNV